MNDLEQRVLDELSARVRAAIAGVAAELRGGTLAALVSRHLVASPEYAALLGGRLRGELGLTRPQETLDEIVAAIAGAASVRSGPDHLTVSLLRVDLREVLAVPSASFVSEGGHRIDWLEWLLTRGDEIIITDHAFQPGREKGSRTGLGVMQRSGVWRVPPEFSGTPQDNWLTRALEPAALEIAGLILTGFVRRLR